VESSNEALTHVTSRPPRRARAIGPREERIAFSIKRATLRALAAGIAIAVGGAYALGYYFGSSAVTLEQQRSLELTAPAVVSAEAKPDQAAPSLDSSGSRPADVVPESASRTPAPRAAERPDAARDAAPPEPRLDVEIGPVLPSAEFGVQLGAFPDVAEARRFVMRHARELMRTKIRIVPTQIPGRGTWHRVRIGAFISRTEADELRRRLSPDLKESAIVVSYK
jgi:cell division septation protein DedD